VEATSNYGINGTVAVGDDSTDGPIERFYRVVA
jgi:hypothetical protein